jgi:uncharacterized OB-fold protein
MPEMEEVSDDELIRRFPDVLVDHDNREHFAALLERRLVLNRCRACGYWIYPHRPLCPRCWSEEVGRDEVGGTGTVFMYTFSFPGHAGSRIKGLDHEKPTPYAAVEWDEQEGLRYLAPVIECGDAEIRIGMPVELTWVERDGTPLPAFRPRR